MHFCLDGANTLDEIKPKYINFKWKENDKNLYNFPKMIEEKTDRSQLY